MPDDQKILFRFSVVLVLPPPGRTKTGVNEQLSVELKRIHAALFGWKHPEATSGCLRLGGRLLDLDASALSWATNFGCHYRERKTS